MFSAVKVFCYKMSLKSNSENSKSTRVSKIEEYLSREDNVEQNYILIKSIDEDEDLEPLEEFSNDDPNEIIDIPDDKDDDDDVVDVP